ncbi:MAG: hypothetical protein IPM54_17805 [Polyangiaceae bacterium]|nr:hypothetical protein [Polyangiaceae bacterium]
MSHLEKNKIVLSVLAMMCSSLAALPRAHAADDNACLLHRPAPIERQLRRLSITLRGHVPDYEEYASVEGLDIVPDSIVDAYLASDEFRLQMRRFHEQQLHTNPATVALRYNGMTLSESTAETAGSSTKVWNLTSTARRKAYRGGLGTHVCQDLPQSDASLGYVNGVPKCKNIGPDSSGNDVCLEGWVNVAPYWDPANPIKICAFDAQDALTYEKTTNPNPGTYACSDFSAQSQPRCGCGPNLSYCMRSTLEPTIWGDLREQLLRLVDDHATGIEPYSEMLTTRRMYTNGRLDFWKKNLAPTLTYSRTYNEWHTGDAALEQNPDWLDTSWRPVMREAPHSGILTLPAFTLRFQTNRGRANRFRIAFLNQYFVAPSTPDRVGCTDDAADVTERCYCRDCHRVLEPLAAHFAVVSEAGSGLLTDFDKIVYSQSACNAQVLPGSSSVCNRFYAKGQAPDPDDPTKTIPAWRLIPLEYADAHPEVAENFDKGPEALAKQIIADGSFARATVAHLFTFLMRREMNLDPASEDNEIPLLDELAKEFQADDNLPRLAKRIVQLAVFRRMP